MSDCKSRNRTALALVVLAASCAHASAQSNAETADILIVHGKVYTADRHAFSEAIALRGNKIIQVGGTQEIFKLRGPRTEVIEAQGSAVLPGFNDIHTHLLEGGLQLANVGLEKARTLPEIQNRISGFAKAHPERAWNQGMGWG